MSNVIILIIDDNETDRYLLARQLKDTGIVKHIYEKQDGEDALEFFEQDSANRQTYGDLYPPIIVFLDINMPRVNGHEFLEKYQAIREKYGLESVVVMMFSSSETQEDIDEALKHEFVKDYLVKGQFTTELLKQKIQAEIA